jgi:hypothetical protein
MYASFRGTSDALDLSIFHQPAKDEVLREVARRSRFTKIKRRDVCDIPPALFPKGSLGLLTGPAKD